MRTSMNTWAAVYGICVGCTRTVFIDVRIDIATSYSMYQLYSHMAKTHRHTYIYIYMCISKSDVSMRHSTWLYMAVYVHIHTYIYIYMCILQVVCIQETQHMAVYGCICATYGCTAIWPKHTDIHIYVHTHVCCTAHVFIDVRIDIHRCTHRYTHIYVHTHVCCTATWLYVQVLCIHICVFIYML